MTRRGSTQRTKPNTMRDKTNVRHLQPAVGNATLERDISMFFFWNFEIYNLEQKEGGKGILEIGVPEIPLVRAVLELRLQMSLQTL